MTPNDVSPRWVGSGWTVFNNKGKPVRQYEPFFTDTHRFEFDVRIGVSPVLFYDPVERVVATLHPNHTWEKVVFDPWRQETWDVNDTVLVADPKTDADVGRLLQPPAGRGLPARPGMHAARSGGALGPAGAGRAAEQGRRPRGTRRPSPTLDALGRTFLTVAHNRFKYSNTPPAIRRRGVPRARASIFDIEGNQREVIDAEDRVVMRYDYDMLGNRIHQASMEAGERWMLNDVAGKPLYAWDSRGHRFRTAYDALRRPTDVAACAKAPAPESAGRAHASTARAGRTRRPSNLRGKVVSALRPGGRRHQRRLRLQGQPAAQPAGSSRGDYKTTLDWSAAVPLEPETFTSRTTLRRAQPPDQ